jgi:tetratricopeptide (TPR) repeat protein
MTTPADPTSPEEKPLCRFAVFEKGADPKVVVAQVTPKQATDRINFQCTANDQAVIDRISRIIDAFRTLPREPTATTPDWSRFIALFPAEGLEVEEIALGDSNVEIHYDLQSGSLVGAHQTLHPYAAPGDDIARNVVAALGQAFPKACDDLADQINAALDNADIAGACKALEDGQQAVYFAGTPKLLGALERFDITALNAECRTRLLNCRLTTAQRLNRFDIAGSDATELLKDPDQDLTDALKASLEMQVALGAIHRGSRESGIVLLKKLLKDPARLDPGDRGWAWRNLSLVLGKDDPEARQAAQLSADAFLEAGAKDEAGKSLMRVVDLLMGENPQAAVDTLDEMIELAAKEGLGNQPIHAAALHARAQRLLTLRQADRALADARASVELLRKVLGAEEQMVRTMHLAAQAARMKGDEEAAIALEREASELTSRYSLPHFKLAERLVTLGENFNVADADALLSDAEAAKNFDLAASVQIYRANGEPGLDDTQRLELLEGTFRQYRGKARPRIVNMIKTAIAVRLRQMGSLDRATDWLEQVHEDEPLSIAGRDTFIDCLWKDEQWGRAANVLRKDLQRRGEAPGLLFGYAKSLFESGDIDGALTAVARSIKLAGDPAWPMMNLATELRDKALDLGGRIAAVPPEAAAGPVSRPEFEAALNEFANFVKAKKRMTFWRFNEKKERVWTSGPEAYAQTLLHTYLQAKFGDRVEIFEELDTGAGRLDLYVKLEGGLSIVVELKMCGNGYSSNYAASGETQIVHYMDNRRTNLGYLVICDARATINAKSVISKSPQQTIIEIFVDVRPEVA